MTPQVDRAEQRRERIIQRASETMAQLREKIDASLAQLAQEDERDAFEEELGDAPPDVDERALRRAVRDYEAREERRRWEEITDISVRNRAARGSNE